jgi:hypothetical protein
MRHGSGGGGGGGAGDFPGPPHPCRSSDVGPTTSCLDTALLSGACGDASPPRPGRDRPGPGRRLVAANEESYCVTPSLIAIFISAL